MRLALARGGEAIDDPVAWFDSLSDETFQLWLTHWTVEPWGGMEWERHAEQMEVLEQIMSMMANKGLHPKHRDWHNRYRARTRNEFMPGDYVAPPTTKKKTGLVEGLSKIERQFSGNNNQ